VTFVSYARNFEDVMLWRALKHVEGGRYIDVGAGLPDEHSVTRAFYERAWHGINIDPNPSHWRRLAGARPRDLNLDLALGAEAGQLTLFEVEGTDFSTLDAGIADKHRVAGRIVRERAVQVHTLAEILFDRSPEQVHFLKIDAAGAERGVLAGANFRQFRPWIVLVEATRPLSTEASHDKWQDLLIAADYRFAWFDGLNRFYIAAEHWTALSPAFALPPNIFDDFLRACDAEQLERILDAESRASRAEISAVRATAQAAQAEAQAAEAHRQRLRAEARVAEADRRMAQAEARAAAAARETARANDRAAAADQGAAQATEEAASLHAALVAGQTEIAALRASSSWRLTAPLRVMRHLLQGHTGLVLQELGMARSRIERLKRIGGTEGSAAKRVSRMAFYALARASVRAPSASRLAASLGRLAPGPWNWLNARNEAYLRAALAVAGEGKASTVVIVGRREASLLSSHHGSPHPTSFKDEMSPAERYLVWIHQHQASFDLAAAGRLTGPAISVLIAVTPASASRLPATLRSLEEQSCGVWQALLSVVSDADPDRQSSTRERIDSAARAAGERVRVIAESPAHLGGALRAAAEAATGAFVMVLEPGDRLHPHA
jgi:FkbM family methyltransferase